MENKFVGSCWYCDRPAVYADALPGFAFNDKACPEHAPRDVVASVIEFLSAPPFEDGKPVNKARLEWLAASYVEPPHTATGYDGNGYSVGDRVELHPGCDLWMRGARYGTVKAIIDTPRDRVRVELDKLPGRRFSAPAERFRRCPD